MHLFLSGSARTCSIHVQVRRPCVTSSLICIIYITVLLTEKLINPRPADDVQTYRHIIANISLS